MERQVFEEHFRNAAEESRVFAKEYLEETLPDAMVFHLHLNSSYDAHATTENGSFPKTRLSTARSA